MEDMFYKLDIRVGNFDKVWAHPDSDKLYCEQINIGEELPRQIASGLQKFVPIEEMTGKCLIIANMKARKLAGFESQGMVLCASNDDHTKVEVLQPEQDCKIGERIYLEDFVNEEPEKWNADFAPVLNPKKKEVEAVLPELKVDEAGYATYKGKKLTSVSGAFFKVKTLTKCNIS